MWHCIYATCYAISPNLFSLLNVCWGFCNNLHFCYKWICCPCQRLLCWTTWIINIQYITSSACKAVCSRQPSTWANNEKHIRCSRWRVTVYCLCMTIKCLCNIYFCFCVITISSQWECAHYAPMKMTYFMLTLYHTARVLLYVQFQHYWIHNCWSSYDSTAFFVTKVNSDMP